MKNAWSRPLQTKQHSAAGGGITSSGGTKPIRVASVPPSKKHAQPHLQAPAQDISAQSGSNASLDKKPPSNSGGATINSIELVSPSLLSNDTGNLNSCKTSPKHHPKQPNFTAPPPGLSLDKTGSLEAKKAGLTSLKPMCGDVSGVGSEKYRPPPAQLRERFLHLCTSIVGQPVIVTRTNGSALEGVLHTTTPFERAVPGVVLPGGANLSDKERCVYVVRACRILKKGAESGNSKNNAQLEDGCTAVIPMHTVRSLEVKSYRLFVMQQPLATSNSNGSAMNGTSVDGAMLRTDTDISSMTYSVRQRHELVAAGAAWTQAVPALSKSAVSGSDSFNWRQRVAPTSSSAKPSSIVAGGELKGSIGGWDQFQANEELFNVRASYDENKYTTSLDKSALPTHVREQAEHLARLMEGEATDNPHIAEERNLRSLKDYDDVDEEDLYSGVTRPKHESEVQSSQTENCPADNSKTETFKTKSPQATFRPKEEHDEQEMNFSGPTPHYETLQTPSSAVNENPVHSRMELSSKSALPSDNRITKDPSQNSQEEPKGDNEPYGAQTDHQEIQNEQATKPVEAETTEKTKDEPVLPVAKSKLNPAAKAFSFNPAAKSFTPSFAVNLSSVPHELHPPTHMPQTQHHYGAMMSAAAGYPPPPAHIPMHPSHTMAQPPHHLPGGQHPPQQYYHPAYHHAGMHMPPHVPVPPYGHLPAYAHHHHHPGAYSAMMQQSGPYPPHPSQHQHSIPVAHQFQQAPAPNLHSAPTSDAGSIDAGLRQPSQSASGSSSPSFSSMGQFPSVPPLLMSHAAQTIPFPNPPLSSHTSLHGLHQATTRPPSISTTPTTSDVPINSFEITPQSQPSITSTPPAVVPLHQESSPQLLQPSSERAEPVAHKESATSNKGTADASRTQITNASAELPQQTYASSGKGGRGGGGPRSGRGGSYHQGSATAGGRGHTGAARRSNSYKVSKEGRSGGSNQAGRGVHGNQYQHHGQQQT